MIPAALDAVVSRLNSRSGESTVEATSAGRVSIAGHVMINMASCDYLGFSRDPLVLAAARNASLQRYSFRSR
jgi:glycine C-acetyltransferase